MNQDKGVSSYVCVFSLKNPSFPEYLCAANSGVMCVDIHSRHPHMLVAGFADGTVAVYNMQVFSQSATCTARSFRKRKTGF